MGVWIEIRKRFYLHKRKIVAPFVGVWIEIVMIVFIFVLRFVAPFVGVWIEIMVIDSDFMDERKSLPSWECGLKYPGECLEEFVESVAPFVGVWIEITMSHIYCNVIKLRKTEIKDKF